MAEPDELLARLAADLTEVFEDELLSVAVHGSLALGDFCPGRSDLDVIAVLVDDPPAATLARLREVHARLARDFPQWGGRLDAEYVSVGAVAAAVQGTAPHPMIIVGGGEPLHEVEASRHYVLNWAGAIQADRPVVGAAPSTVLPAIDNELIRRVVLQHVRGWSGWVDEMRHTGGQAYTVLTLCRAAELLATGHQVSKLAAAHAGASRCPDWSELIEWARAWWYDGGSDQAPGRFDDVRGFVDDSSARLLNQYDVAPNRDRDAAHPILPLRSV